MPAYQASEPTYDIQIEYDAPIPMRDGTVLRANIYRPRAEGQFPVLMERVAYELLNRCKTNAEFYTPRGYVFIGQSVRGAFASDGVFNPFRADGWGANRDGYDSIEWAGAQPWSNGKVGMVDGSYSGITQYMVAPTRPPHLKALFVREGSVDIYQEFPFRNGAYQMHLHRDWTMRTILTHLQHESAPPETAAARDRLEKAVAEMDSWYRHRPLKSCPPLEGIAAWYFEHLEHPDDGPYWWAIKPALKFSEVDVPIMHLGGWFDIFIESTLGAFSGIRARGRTEACRLGQRAIIGPWIHGPDNAGQRQVGDLDFGSEADYNIYTHRLQWYDYWLKGIDNAAMDGPPLRIFLMGDNRWLDLEDWPPPDVIYQPFYFREGSGQNAESLNNGRLTFEPPEGAERPDSFVYDPDDPIPSLIMYPEQGPTDHRSVEGRMLTYTSDVLTQDVTIIGPVKAVLYGLSSAPDTDWVVRLSDVWPDGRSISVCDGILRARYRQSLAQPKLLTPGQIHRFEVGLAPTAQVFKAGHRIRVAVASSDFPRYAPNLNTGDPFGEEVRAEVALNTLFHDPMRMSHLLLPRISSPGSSLHET